MVAALIQSIDIRGSIHDDAQIKLFSTSRFRFHGKKSHLSASKRLQ